MKGDQAESGLRPTFSILTSLPTLLLHDRINRTFSTVNRAPHALLDQTPHFFICLLNPQLPVPSPTPQIPRPPHTPPLVSLFGVLPILCVCPKYLRMPKPVMEQFRSYTPTLPISVPTRAQQGNIVCRTATFRFPGVGREDHGGRPAVHGVGKCAERPKASV